MYAVSCVLACYIDLGAPLCLGFFVVVFACFCCYFGVFCCCFYILWGFFCCCFFCFFFLGGGGCCYYYCCCCFVCLFFFVCVCLVWLFFFVFVFFFGGGSYLRNFEHNSVHPMNPHFWYRLLRHFISTSDTLRLENNYCHFQTVVSNGHF